MLRRSSLRALALVALLGLLTPPSVLSAPITFDTTNPQYFNYKSKTMALVGVSGEYICHMEQMPDKLKTRDERIIDRDRHYCTYDITDGRRNYQRYIDDIAGRGLNKIRMWVGLNHSPGAEPSREPVPSATPFPVEQPFVRRADAKWDLTRFSEDVPFGPEGYFTRVYNVIDYAASKDVIVEVTLFDAFSGDWTKGPWHQSRNANTAGPGGTNKPIYFTDVNQFTGYECVDHDCSEPVKNAREIQRAFLRKMVEKLNPLENFYWEISNEPDGKDVDTLDETNAIKNFHNSMIAEIVAAELGKKKHLIAVNYHTPTLQTDAVAHPDIRIVNSHYVDIIDNPTRHGAIEMIRALLNGSPQKIFGFNEGRIYPATNDANLLAARAEAWEFMFNEGGSFDHLGYEWDITSVSYPNPSRLRIQLGVLSKFLNGTPTTPGVLNLKNISRQTQSPPLWIVSGLPPYPPANQTSGSPRTYWGAMQWTRNQYLLYIHHSLIYPGDPNAPKPETNRRYDPKPGSYIESLSLNLGNTAGCFKADWISPVTGLELSTNYINWNPTTMLPGGYHLPPPSPYVFDIALRIVRQSTPCSP